MKTINLGEVSQIKTGKLNANQANENGEYPFFTCAIKISRIDQYAYDCECVLVAGNGDLNVKYYEGKFNAYQRVYIIESVDKNQFNVKFLYYFLQSYIETLRKNSIGGVIKYIRLQDLTNAKLLNIPIEKQERIIRILEKTEKIKIKRKQQIETLLDLKESIFLDIFVRNKKYSNVKLKTVIDSITAGLSPGGENRKKEVGELGVLTTSAVTYGIFDPKAYKVPFKEKIEGKKLVFPSKNSILVSRMNTKELVGASCIVEEDYGELFIPDRIWNLMPNTEMINPYYLISVIQSKLFRNQLDRISTGTSGSMQNITQKNYMNLEIPLIDFGLQEEYASKVASINNKVRMLTYSLEEIEILYDVLLQQAFSGELFKEEKVKV